MSNDIKKSIAVIAIDFDQELEAFLEKIPSMIYLKEYYLHLINVLPMSSEIHREEVLHSLNEVREMFLPIISSENVECKCIFSEEKAFGICDYAGRVNADLLVVLSKEEGSGQYGNEKVAHFLVNHCTASILLVR